MWSIAKVKSMKFKQQEEKVENNTFLEEAIGLCSTCLRFMYSIKSFEDFLGNGYKAEKYRDKLSCNLQKLIKLCISLDGEHNYPEFNPELKAAESIADLKALEEEYYNKLKVLGKKGLEANDIEVVSYLSELIAGFEHCFCTLDEGNISSEASS